MTTRLPTRRKLRPQLPQLPCKGGRRDERPTPRRRSRGQTPANFARANSRAARRPPTLRHPPAGAEAKRPKISPAQIRARLAERRATRPASTIRLPEIIALAAAVLLLLGAAGAYFFLLVPERARLVALGNERAQVQSELRACAA